MTSDNIKVAVRMRPLIPREIDSNSTVAWTSTNQTITQKNGTGKYATDYVFDRVFGMEQNTDDVFNEVALPIVQGAMQGFNGTVFAYGQTSSGKTYTMLGTEDNPGITPRVVNDIFDTIENNPEREYLIRVSYLEIYNENVQDLLAEGNSKKPLEVREDTDGNVFVNNLKEALVTQMPEIMDLMEKGQASRHVGATNMNEHSSRSHTIFRIIIESRLRDAEGAVMVSQLNLVDLAGSEKAKATGATGQRLTEGGFINKSLFILGNVISQLSDGVSFVSYRDSRLTRILQNSLGGNSKTVIICNISPVCIEETHSSLRFATNAKRIKNKPVQNEVVSDAALLQRYKKEINKLQTELIKTRSLQTVVVQEENEALQQKLAEKEQLRQQQQEKIDRLEKLICVSSRNKPTTPDVRSFEARKKRRETWCPGKAGLLFPPKMPKFSSSPAGMKSEKRFPRSLPSVDEASGGEDFLQLNDIPEIELPELPMDVTSFSNEDEWSMDCIEKACQTETIVEEPGCPVTPDNSALKVKDALIEELKTELESSKEEVNTLNTLIDDRMAEEGRLASERDLKIYQLEQDLKRAEEEKRTLEESMSNLTTPSLTDELASAEEKETLTTKIQSLEEENKALSDKLLSTEDEIKKLREQIESCPKQETNLSSEMEWSEKLEAAEKQIRQLTQALAAADEDNLVLMEGSCFPTPTDQGIDGEIRKDLEEKLAQAEATVLQLNEELSTAKSALGEVQEELVKVQNENSRKTSVARPSIAGLDLVSTQLDSLRKENSDKDQTIQELKAQSQELQSMMEEVLDEINSIKKQKIAMEEERDRLSMQLKDMQTELEDRDVEYKEMEEFLSMERDLKNDSIMSKQVGEEMVDTMHSKITSLEKTLADSQAMLIDTNKTNSTSKNEIDDLQKALTETKKELEQLSNEKQDFNMYQELDREKHKRREAELTAQLEEAYVENAELRAASATNPAEPSNNLEASLRLAETPQLEQLQTELQELKENLETSEEQVSKLQLDIEKTKEEREEMLENLREELEARHRGELEDSQSEKNELVSKMDALSSELVGLNEKLEKANSELEGLEKRNEEYECFRLEAVDKVEKLEEEVKKAEDERLKLSEGLEGRLVEQQEKSEEEMREVRDQHERIMKEENEKNEKELQEKILAIRDEAMSRLEEAKQALSQTQNDSKLVAECDEANAKVKELTEQFEELQQQLKDVTESSETQIMQLLQERDEAVGHRELLMEQVKELSNSQSSHQAESQQVEQLTQTIQQHEQTINLLTIEKEESQAINSQLDAEMELLRKEAHARPSTAISEEEFEELSMKAMDLEEQVNSLREERQAAKERIEEVEEEMKNLQKELDEAKSNAAESSVDSEEITELKVKVDSYEGQVGHMEECIQEQFTELNAAKEEIQSLRKEKEDAETLAEGRLNDLVDIQGELDLLKESQGEIEDLRTQKVSAEEVAEKVQKNLIDSKTEIERIQEENEIKIGELEAERDAGQRSVQKMERKINSLQMELDVLREAGPATDDEQLQMELVMYKDQIESLNECMGEQSEAIVKERALVKSLNKEVSNIEGEKEELLQKVAELQENMDILKTGTEEIVNNLKEERDTAANLAQKLNEEVEKYASEREELVANKDMLESKQSEIENLEVRVNEMTQERDSLQERIVLIEEQLKDKSNAKDGDLAKIQAEMRETEEECRSVKTERDDLQLVCNDINEQFMAKEEEWMVMRRDFENKIVDLEKAMSSKGGLGLDELRTKNQRLEEWYKLAEEEKDRLRKVCDDGDDKLAAEYKKRKSEKQQLEGKMFDLERELEELRPRCKELYEMFENGEKEQQRLRDLCDQVDDEKEKAEKEKTQLEETIAELKIDSERSSTSAPASTNQSERELEELRAKCKENYEMFLAGEKEQDRLRDLCDQVDDELDAEKEKAEKEKNQLEQTIEKLKIELERSASAPVSSGQSDRELQELRAKCKELYGMFESGEKEQDRLRDLCDKVDDELDATKEKAEKEKAELEQTIEKLKKRSGNGDKVKKLEHDKMMLQMKVNELENTAIRDPRHTQIKDLKDENKLLAERVDNMRNELRRYKNQAADASFVQPGWAPTRAAASSEGIVGSVKVLTLEAEKAALERELKKGDAKMTRLLQQNSELSKTNAELKKYCKKNLRDLDSEALRGIANSPAVQTPSSSNPWSQLGATGSETKSSRKPGLDEEQCTTQ